MHLNFGLLEHSINLLRSEKFDLIHAHDWLVAHAGITLKRAFGTPLVATMHATEHGRWNGIHNDLQNYIHSMEWLLNYETIGTIVCSHFMRNEMFKLFNLPENKVFVFTKRS
ncbi:MAG: hypothetical protein KatS3mg068_0128 [Candidatus Sericytochromatia bacterium]|nr:MAG: hypothetical protein KatS3mg068_0128 [Candidatus Sericytochromatia bacterium]